MPLFGKTSIQKFTPKTAKFKDIYKKASGYKKISSTARREIIKALQEKGKMHPNKISKVLSGKDLTQDQLKEITTHLNRAGVSSFDSDPSKTVNSHFRSEAIKAKNIARIRKEHMQEAYNEDRISSSHSSDLKTSGTSKTNKPILRF